MIYFTNQYAKIWEIKMSEKYADLRISTHTLQLAAVAAVMQLFPNTTDISTGITKAVIVIGNT